MSKFKVGDRVRVVKYASRSVLASHLLGEKGSVTLASPSYRGGWEYEVRLDNPDFAGAGPGGSRLMYEDELERLVGGEAATGRDMMPDYGSGGLCRKYLNELFDIVDVWLFDLNDAFAWQPRR